MVLKSLNKVNVTGKKGAEIETNTVAETGVTEEGMIVTEVDHGTGNGTDVIDRDPMTDHVIIIDTGIEIDITEVVDDRSHDITCSFYKYIAISSLCVCVKDRLEFVSLFICLKGVRIILWRRLKNCV